MGRGRVLITTAWLGEWCDHDSNDAPAAPTGASLVELPELLARSDAVAVHGLLSDDTRRLINADTIARMKHGAVLVHAARSGVVEAAAVVDALHSGRIAAAALDTFETNPCLRTARLAASRTSASPRTLPERPPKAEHARESRRQDPSRWLSPAKPPEPPPTVRSSLIALGHDRARHPRRRASPRPGQ
ncbi:hypothetical protein RKD29_007690 [Streptomyces tendae]|uniref:NAD(P)-dependent oxidoreductase n=1 Tax=Streptomyces tendae TaxID=1932 RepID=UPI003835AB95